MKKATMLICLTALTGVFSFRAEADNVGLCKAIDTENGKSIYTTVYKNGEKTAMEADSPQGKFRTIKNGPNVFIIVDAQRLCLQSPVPIDDVAAGTKTITNSDGSKVDCTWSERTAPASIYECPTGYTKKFPSGK